MMDILLAFFPLNVEQAQKNTERGDAFFFDFNPDSWRQAYIAYTDAINSHIRWVEAYAGVVETCVFLEKFGLMPLYERDKYIKRMEKRFRKMMEINPNNRRARRARALYHWFHRNYATSRLIARKLVEDYPEGEFEAFVYLLVTNRNPLYDDFSRNLLNRWLKRSKRFYFYWIKARAYERVRDWNQAYHYLQKALNLNPYFTWGWIETASLMEKLGLGKERIIAYREALKTLKPYSNSIFFIFAKMARYYEEIGDETLAIKYWQELVSGLPSYDPYKRYAQKRIMVLKSVYLEEAARDLNLILREDSTF